FTAPPEVRLNTRNALPPLIVTTFAPGPVIVRLVLMISSPLLSVSVPERVDVKLMESPPTEAAIAALNEPAPLSLRFVTVRTAANASGTHTHKIAINSASAVCLSPNLNLNLNLNPEGAGLRLRLGLGLRLRLRLRLGE